MANNWTEEQLLAIKTRKKNLLVAAAAGSGKTAVLVERIINMITDKENPVDIDKLLVVTFTSAAAAEMRERVGEAISRELEKHPDSSVLANQLTLLGGADITTMHSFCLEVIKNNFHEIDLDPGFRIGDQTECEIIKNEVMDELLEEKYKEANKDFLSLVESYGGKRNDDNLRELLFRTYSFSMSGPWPHKWLEEKAEAFNLSKDQDIDELEWVKILKKDLLVKVDSIYNSYKSAADLCYEEVGLEKYHENIDDDLSQLEVLKGSCMGPISDILKAIGSIKLGKLKVVRKNDDIQEVQEIYKTARDKMKKDISKLSADLHFGGIDDIKEECEKLYPLMKQLSALVIEFENMYKAKKKERGILDFNDMEHVCLEILTQKDEEGNIVPSKTALRYREKFEEVFVDEYQDSNNVQETIINMVSRKSNTVPNVFMVGDVKQSIYRFRQAKPELFLEKYNTYKDSKDISDNKDCPNMKISLFKNFRSRGEILSAANFIFYNIMSEVAGELDYTEKEALNLGADYKDISRDNVYDLEEEEIEIAETAGNVELNILNLSGDKTEDTAVITNESSDNEELEENVDAMQYEARIVAKRINELIHGDKPYIIFDKSLGMYRKIKYKDIVILLRTVKTWSDVLVDELGMYGIPVYADTGSGYFDTVEIKTVMSLLHIIDNPLQDIHVIAVLKSPIFSFSMEMLTDLRLLINKTDEHKYYYDIIKEVAEGNKHVDDEALKKKCIEFLEKLNSWREKSLFMPVDEFIWYLIMDTSYYGFVGALNNGVKRQANLRILFQRAKQFEGTSLKGLFNFITFINKLRRSSGDMGSAKILGENEDVVRIMSIHKSKGLEFPVVILAGCGKQFNLMDLNKEVLLHEDLGYGPNYIDIEKRTSKSSLARTAIKLKQRTEIYSEEIRILYVALTRAKEKLIITGKVNDFESQVKLWASAASSVTEDNTISPREVLNAKCYLDWIAMCVARHKDGEKLRAGRTDLSTRDDNSRWDVHMWIKSDLTVDNNLSTVDKNDEMKIENVDITNEIRNRLEYSYKYKDVTSLPSNVSVSDLKKAAIEDEEIAYKLYESEYVRKPKFLSEKKGITGAERGTVVHFVMQHIDLDKVSTVDKIKEQIDEMVDLELLRKEEAEAVNPFMIFKFFTSKIGKEMLMAHKGMNLLERELPFVTEIPAEKLITRNSSIDTKTNEAKDTVRLQGIIDCFFEYRGKLILLDYKTDYVEDGNEQEIVDKYKVQMEYYSDALEKILGRSVDEIYLYLFSLNKETRVILK